MNKAQMTTDLINNIKEKHEEEISNCRRDSDALNVLISEQNVLLMDIACSLALIADGFNRGGRE
jgi:hypothetical protein